MSGDGCCPPGGNALLDSDCPAVCGNRLVERARARPATARWPAGTAGRLPRRLPGAAPRAACSRGWSAARPPAPPLCELDDHQGRARAATAAARPAAPGAPTTTAPRSAATPCWRPGRPATGASPPASPARCPALCDDCKACTTRHHARPRVRLHPQLPQRADHRLPGAAMAAARRAARSSRIGTATRPCGNSLLEDGRDLRSAQPLPDHLRRRRRPLHRRSAARGRRRLHRPLRAHADPDLLGRQRPISCCPTGCIGRDRTSTARRRRPRATGADSPLGRGPRAGRRRDASPT